MQVKQYRESTEAEQLAVSANLVETSDAPNGTGTSYVMSVGDTFSGELNFDGDRDWVAVELQAGKTYDIALSGSPSGDGTLSDPYLRVYDSKGTLVTQNDDGGPGLESAATVTINTTGTYYISAGAYADSESGTYRIAITEVEPAPTADLDSLAAYLTDGFWQEIGTTRRAFDTSFDDVISVNITALTPEGQQLARWALEAWETVADIEFREVTGNADITFDDDQSGAFSNSSYSGETILSSRVNVSTRWLQSYGTTIDSYSYQTYVHEIGHALGLGHQGNYNGKADYGVDENFANDSWQVSVMSYFSQTDNTTIDASYAFLGTPMMADIVAIQDLYGAPDAFSVTGGNTTYGADTNLGGLPGAVFAAVTGAPVSSSSISGANLAATIYDVGGIDRIDLSASTANNRLDLTPGSYSDIDGLTGNLGIDRGTLVEHATGGAGNDTITGNAVNNHVEGLAGDDSIEGGGGDDYIKGDAGDDTLRGGAGADLLLARNGFDVAHGGDDNDTIIGHNGNDTLNGDGGNDEINGGPGSDRIDGGAGADALEGLNGFDLMNGGAGNDTITGHNGEDTLNGDAGDDSLAGSDMNDLIDGGIGADHLDGQNGHDEVHGGDDADTVIGGNGIDTLYGDAGNDSLSGDAANDLIFAGSGADTASGGYGNDTLSGGLGRDVLFGNNRNDVLDGEAGEDRLDGGRGNDLLRGGADNDTLDGGPGDDTLTGGGGNDALTGGPGVDTFVFDSNDMTGTDAITDFENELDTIRIDGAAQFSDLSITQTGGDTVVSWASGQITLAGETGQIDADDFLFA